MIKMPHIYDKEITCNICETIGSINDKTFIHTPEGEPYAYLDYVICQYCGHKQLI